MVCNIRHWHKIEYESLHPICFDCGRCGHIKPHCQASTPVISTAITTYAHSDNNNNASAVINGSNSGISSWENMHGDQLMVQRRKKTTIKKNASNSYPATFPMKCDPWTVGGSSQEASKNKNKNILFQDSHKFKDEIGLNLRVQVKRKKRYLEVNI